MAQRFAVVIDDPDHGPCFLPQPEDGLPEIFPSWEAARDAGDALVGDVLAVAHIIRLRDG